MLKLPISLADVGIHGQPSGALLHCSDRRKVLADVDDHPPLGEPAAQLPVLRTPLVQTVQALSENLLARRPGQPHPALVHRHAGDHPETFHHLNETLALVSLLLESLVLQDHSGERGETLGGAGEQQLAVPPSHLGKYSAQSD